MNDKIGTLPTHMIIKFYEEKNVIVSYYVVTKILMN